MTYIENLKSLLEMGASVVIKPCGVDAAVELAQAARGGGGRLTIKGGYGHDAMQKVASAGGNHVTFDLSD